MIVTTTHCRVALYRDDNHHTIACSTETATKKCESIQKPERVGCLTVKP